MLTPIKYIIVFHTYLCLHFFLDFLFYDHHEIKSKQQSTKERRGGNVIGNEKYTKKKHGDGI
jgi:hypothetical protein